MDTQLDIFEKNHLTNKKHSIKIVWSRTKRGVNMNKNNATLSKVRSYLSDQKYENEKESKFFKTDRYR